MKNWFLFAVLSVLGALSVITLSSIVPTLALRQGAFAIGSITVFLVMQKLPMNFYFRNRWIWYAVTVALLAWVLLSGVATRNTARWIYIGAFTLQPSQLAIITSGIALASYAAKTSFKQLKSLIFGVALIMLPAVLILAEPDLGSTIIYLASFAPLFILKPLKGLHIISALGIGLFVVAFSWIIILQPYQKERIFSFMDPSGDPSGSAYNARQSLIAVGSGQFFGRGLGLGVQSHLRFLPEKHTDFFFASFAEEYGFIGSFLLLLIYGSLSAFLIFQAKNHPDPRAKLFIILTTTFILLQTSINIGMNSGLFPITGVTLPLLSYGGSSFVTTTILLGLCQSFIKDYSLAPSIHIR